MKAVFLDRDGTIIEDMHYLRDPNLIQFIPGSLDALKKLQEHNYKIFIVSNQSGVGRGIITDAEFQAVHEKFAESLNANGITVQEYLYCFHHPEDPCLCRKPKTGLIPRKIGSENIVFTESFAIGDKLCDLQLGDALQAKGCLVLTGNGEKTYAELEAQGLLERYVFAPSLSIIVEEIVGHA